MYSDDFRSSSILSSGRLWHQKTSELASNSVSTFPSRSNITFGKVNRLSPTGEVETTPNLLVHPRYFATQSEDANGAPPPRQARPPLPRKAQPPNYNPAFPTRPRSSTC